MTRPSLRLRLACLFLRATGGGRVLQDPVRTLAQAERAQQRARQRGPSLPRPRHERRARVRRLELAGLDCVELVPRRGRTERTIVYLPGGGYLNPPVAQHWDLVTALCVETRARVVVPLYPLTPTAEVVAVSGMTADLHALLLAEEGRAPVWAGDSAGGGLALATTLVAARRGDPPPAHLVLLAPWLDVRLENPGIDAVLPRDPMLALPGLRAAGRAWARDVGVDDPLVSPIEADPAGLPPITLVVGDRDVFVADARLLAERVERAGGDLRLEVTPGGFHVYPAATFLPESVRARRLIAERLGVVEGEAR